MRVGSATMPGNVPGNAEFGIADLLLLLVAADREAPVGEGCVALSISRKRCGELLAEGYPLSAVDRAAKIAAVESAVGEIVTVLRPRGHRGSGLDLQDGLIAEVIASPLFS